MTRNQISLPPVKYRVYPIDTNGDAIGPVVLAPPKVQWQATRAEKKKIFGPDHLIDVGGKLGQLDVDAPEPIRKKPHTHDAMEPVFFHNTQAICHQELLDVFSLIGVAGLSPGDGTCTVACTKKMLPYVGVTLNEQHSARLLAHRDANVSAWD